MKNLLLSFSIITLATTALADYATETRHMVGQHGHGIRQYPSESNVTHPRDMQGEGRLETQYGPRHYGPYHRNLTNVPVSSMHTGEVAKAGL
jgi:hypothetical protein